MGGVSLAGGAAGGEGGAVALVGDAAGAVGGALTGLVAGLTVRAGPPGVELLARSGGGAGFGSRFLISGA